MKASVIIPTYNGARKIGYLLEALTEQINQTFEVIVVIDGSNDGTDTVVKEFSNKLPGLQVIAQQNSGRSVTRNRGAAMAKGDILIFYDDDMIPEPTSVEKHIQFHQICSNTVLCGNIVEIAGPAKSDIQNYKAYLSGKWTSRFPEGVTSITPDNLFLTAANLSLPKKIFHELGGFDERLRDIEDREFGFRILKLNLPAYFDKSNAAVHNEIISCKSYIARVRQYTHAQDKLKELIPSLPNRPETSSIKKWLLYFFSFSFWVNWIDDEKMLIHLPKTVRYKIYEWVIFARGVVFISGK